MKKQIRRLTLNRETVRVLEAAQIPAGIAGGVSAGNTSCQCFVNTGCNCYTNYMDCSVQC
jgi:hypothetical protein